MEYLSPLDASFLDLEDGDPHASLAISSVAILDGPAPEQAELVRLLRGRLALVPRYRQRVRRVPFNLGRPVWEDDPGFDLDFHLRRTAVAAPGDDTALANLIARVMSQRLDQERPLWENWVIEGLPGGRWALLSKVHHCMIDGLGGNELYRLICDRSPKPRRAVADHWHPAPAGSGLSLTLDALGQLARMPFDQTRGLLAAAAEPGRSARQVAGVVRGATELVRALRPAPETSLAGPLGRARRYAVARLPLDDLTAVAREQEATVNDVYLAAVAGAFRRLLQSRDEEPRAGAVRTLVPVSVRRENARHVLDNRISSLLLDLPIELSDPQERLRAVHERVEALRGRHEVDAAASLVALAAEEPFAAVSFLIRSAIRLPQRGLATVTTNVPGPAGTLYVLGRPIREILPYVPIAERMRIGVALMTYGGQATIGVTADFSSVPEADDFAEGIAADVTRLSRPPHAHARTAELV